MLGTNLYLIRGFDGTEMFAVPSLENGSSSRRRSARLSLVRLGDFYCSPGPGRADRRAADRRAIRLRLIFGGRWPCVAGARSFDTSCSTSAILLCSQLGGRGHAVPRHAEHCGFMAMRAVDLVACHWPGVRHCLCLEDACLSTFVSPWRLIQTYLRLC